MRSARKSKEEGKVDGKSKDGSKSATKLENDNNSKIKDHASKSGGKSVDVSPKSASKSREGVSGSPKISKSKQDSSPQTGGKSKQDSSLQTGGKSKQDSSPQTGGKSKQDSSPQTGGKSKQDMSPQTGGKSKLETPKISFNAKTKPPKIVVKSNANGKSKPSSSKVKESEDIKNSADSDKVSESTKGNSPSPSKTQGSEVNPGKKRRRGSRS